VSWGAIVMSPSLSCGGAVLEPVAVPEGRAAGGEVAEEELVSGILACREIGK
jgi:hypothetical protein